MLLSILLLAVSKGYLSMGEETTIDLHMPNVRPDHNNDYLCVAKRIDHTQEYFIVSFEPHASASKVHHMIIYGCTVPGQSRRDTPNYVWECGEMSRSARQSKSRAYELGPICESKSNIIFSWALDAPAIELPEHVGFKIGRNSDIKYLVLQVHYSDTSVYKNNPDLVDESGVVLRVVYGPKHDISKQAGVFVLMTDGVVHKGVSKHRAACRIYEDRELHPFRFRTHTHRLGTKVGAYRTKLGKGNKPELIGERNPQDPQMFYPLDDVNMVITQGDEISAYCDFNNTLDHDVQIGFTSDDEMCNFYIMYWVYGDKLLDESNCIEVNDR